MHCPNSAQLLDIISCELNTPLQAGFPSRWMECGGLKQPEQFAKEYLMYNLVRKLEPFAKKSEVPVAVLRKSLTAFADAEHRCLVVNNYGCTWSPLYEKEKLFFSEALRLTKAWISRTLMDIWPRWEAASFTGGASRNCSRARSFAPLKWAGHAERDKLSATALALRIVKLEIQPCFGPSWSDRGYSIENDSHFDFVTKDAEVVRFMAMEPEMNMLVQGCIGNAFRYALLKQGIDLNSQKRNQDLAYAGSCTGHVATLDQTSASDCIAVLMANLLPQRYKEWVLDSRTPFTTVGNRSHKLQKIATMGNGFIFELQSLIFAGFAYACTSLTGGRESDIAVYGDDIVVSTCVAEPLMQTLEYFGLIPNMKKSFWRHDDPFRESCGKHYFAGRDVTPFYVKEPLIRLRARFRALNGLYYWSQRTGVAIPRTLKYLVSLIAKGDRIIVPPSYSIDSGIHFPVSGGILPERRMSHGQARYHFEYLARRAIDITEKLSDYVKYQDWLREPPVPLIDHAVWEKALGRLCTQPRFVLRRRAVLPGVPREVRKYGCGGPRDEDHVRTSGNVGSGEIP